MDGCGYVLRRSLSYSACVRSLSDPYLSSDADKLRGNIRYRSLARKYVHNSYLSCGRGLGAVFVMAMAVRHTDKALLSDKG